MAPGQRIASAGYPKLPTIGDSVDESEKYLGMRDLEEAAYPELREYREEHPVADAAQIDKYVQRHQGKEYFTKEKIETDLKNKAARLARQLNDSKEISGLVWKTGRFVGNTVVGSDLTDVRVEELAEELMQQATEAMGGAPK
jgi:hypothetical protein